MQYVIHTSVLPKRVEKERKAKLLARKKKAKPAPAKPPKREDKSPGRRDSFLRVCACGAARA